MRRLQHVLDVALARCAGSLHTPAGGTSTIRGGTCWQEQPLAWWGARCMAASSTPPCSAPAAQQVAAAASTTPGARSAAAAAAAMAAHLDAEAHARRLQEHFAASQQHRQDVLMPGTLIGLGQQPQSWRDEQPRQRRSRLNIAAIPMLPAAQPRARGGGCGSGAAGGLAAAQPLRRQEREHEEEQQPGRPPAVDWREIVARARRTQERVGGAQMLTDTFRRGTQAGPAGTD
jgi:hypothetical protein